MGCHHNGSNCPFNSVIGNYIATDQSSSFANCYIGCSPYPLTIASSGNCNSVIIKNIDGTGSNITATYMQNDSGIDIFYIYPQTYNYNGTVYNTIQGGYADFRGDSLWLFFDARVSSSSPGQEITLIGIKQ